MIDRLRLHVSTDRFLAERRGDRTWEAACDYAVLTLARLASRLRPSALAAPICPAAMSGRTRAAGLGHSVPGGRQ